MDDGGVKIKQWLLLLTLQHHHQQSVRVLLGVQCRILSGVSTLCRVEIWGTVLQGGDGSVWDWALLALLELWYYLCECNDLWFWVPPNCLHVIRSFAETSVDNWSSLHLEEWSICIFYLTHHFHGFQHWSK
jgi:hypothetical protein